LVADHRIYKPLKKLNNAHYRFIDNAMAENDELSAPKLYNMLKSKFPEVSVSLSTVKQARRELGYVEERV